MNIEEISFLQNIDDLVLPIKLFIEYIILKKCIKNESY